MAPFCPRNLDQMAAYGNLWWMQLEVLVDRTNWNLGVGLTNVEIQKSKEVVSFNLVGLQLSLNVTNLKINPPPVKLKFLVPPSRGVLHLKSRHRVWKSLAWETIITLLWKSIYLLYIKELSNAINLMKREEVRNELLSFSVNLMPTFLKTKTMTLYWLSRT
jgi:hypothetical protein